MLRPRGTLPPFPEGVRKPPPLGRQVRPFCEGGRCEKLFLGAQHNYEKGLLKCAWSARGP